MRVRDLFGRASHSSQARVKPEWIETLDSTARRNSPTAKPERPKKTTTTSDSRHYPFELPSGWVWCRLGDLANYKKGPFGSSLTKSMFVSKDLNTYKVYEQKNAIHKDHTLGSYYISQEKYNTMIGLSVQPHDIIVSCAGTIGETYVLPDNIENGIINQALMIIRLYNREIERFYLLYFDYILKEQAYKESKGTAIKNIPPFDVLKNFFIPIPPIAEQIRILKAVDKWLTFVNSIDESKSDLLDIIKQTKSKVLDLAIHGKLVPQDPADEPASELLKRVNPSAEITCDNEQYGNLPQNWVTTKLGSVGKWKAGATPSRIISDYYGGTIPWLKTGDLNDGFITKIPEFITQKALDETSVFLNPTGSVLIAMYGATIGKVGILTFPATTNQACCACSGYFVNKLYLFYFLIANRSNFLALGGGGAQPNISKEKIVNLSFPLPPLAEQHRIVDKIEELFAQLDAIENSLQA